MTTYTYGFVCDACIYGCETIESAMAHSTTTGHVVSEYHHGSYVPVIHYVDGSTTYTPANRV
jgi:hypothetical protein